MKPELKGKENEYSCDLKNESETRNMIICVFVWVNVKGGDQVESLIQTSQEVIKYHEIETTTEMKE